VPVKQRVAKGQRPFFSAEAVALFAELERAPGGDLPFSEESRKLAGLLGLLSQWWTGNHVNGRRELPIHPPGYVAHADFWRVYEVRQQLLAVCAQLPTQERERAEPPTAA
jgi:hypothetical protein